ncbi:MAG: hypothetical protein EOP62_03990 [Sphingomonadales bacterium]|nr:MAG: hypothetical protein EOP62_03990 [Sphingomonadales bacterium]
MIRQVMVLALASALLGGCWGQSAPPPPPVPTDRPRPATDRPYEWITAEPECRGSLSRGEWIVCDNKHVRYLHRTLAEQWAATRQNAERRVLGLMRRQQDALLAERRLCEDTACVATAYRRYISGYAQPEPKPSWTPKPRKPVKARPQRPRGEWQNDWRYEDRRPNRPRGAESCAAEVGGSASAYLVKQCRTVNGRWDRSCTADMTCDDLRAQIKDGCSESDRRPGFCNRR